MVPIRWTTGSMWSIRALLREWRDKGWKAESWDGTSGLFWWNKNLQFAVYANHWVLFKDWFLLYWNPWSGRVGCSCLFLYHPTRFCSSLRRNAHQLKKWVITHLMCWFWHIVETVAFFSFFFPPGAEGSRLVLEQFGYSSWDVPWRGLMRGKLHLCSTSERFTLSFFFHI